MKSSAASQVGNAVRFTLKVKSGPDTGKSFQLLPPKATIGRDPGNKVVLTDPKVSRNGAVIEFRPDRIVAVDLSSRGNMQINGLPTREMPLKDGDVIALGETALFFRIEMVAAKPQTGLQIAHARGMDQPGRGATPARPSGTPRYDPGYRVGGAARSRGASADDGKKLRFYLIVAVVIGGLIYLLTSESKNPNAEKGLRTQEEIAAEIRLTDEKQEVLLKSREFKSEEERRRYEEAQNHYLQGFRDYQKGNYSRAMRSFETARAIDPAHQMATRYYTLAQRQRDEFVARHILEGKRYMEKTMYTRCVSSLDNALKALNDAGEGDLKVKEAKSLRSLCEAHLKERF